MLTLTRQRLHGEAVDNPDKVDNTDNIDTVTFECTDFDNIDKID